MKRRIILHGHLKKLVPDQIELEIETAAEAVLALSTLEGTRLCSLQGGGRPRVRVVGFDTDLSLTEPLPSSLLELHVVPDFTGGKTAGIFQVVLGAIIVVIGVIMTFFPGTQGAAPYVIMMGVGMMFGGVLAMISQAPRVEMPQNGAGSADPEASKYLGGPRNTTQIGTPIPILYGRFKHYGQVLSSNLDAVDVAV